VLFIVQLESMSPLLTICAGLFQVLKLLVRGELPVIKYCLVLPQRISVSPEESILFRAHHAFPLPCKKEEPAGMGGLDGSLVLFQFTPAQTSKKVIRYHFRSRDVPPSTGVGVSGRANPSNSSQCSREIPPPPEWLFPFSVGGYF
jgi:hypothetical protein